MAISMGNGNGVGTVGLAQQSRERRFNFSISLGIGLGVWPPRLLGFVRKLFGAEPQDFGEGSIDLDDGAIFVADKERFLQRVDERGTPPRVMVAQSRQFDVRVYPSQQIRRGERFDEVVVGARRQALDRGFLTRARGQQ